MGHYTEDNGITDYWDSQYVAWDRNTPEVLKRAIFDSKDQWFETRFAHILPRRLPTGREDRVLDYGSGNSMFAPALLRRFENYDGLDTSPKAIEIAGRYFGPERVGWRVQLIERADDIPFSDNTFDCVVTITVIQHQPIPKRLSTIAEIKRVLKPGGLYLGMEWVDSTTAAWDMPPQDTNEWLEAWKPIELTFDDPPEYPTWKENHVWYGYKP